MGKNCLHDFGPQAALQSLNQLESGHQTSDIFTKLRERFSIILGLASDPFPEINVWQTIPKLIPESVPQIRS